MFDFLKKKSLAELEGERNELRKQMNFFEKETKLKTEINELKMKNVKSRFDTFDKFGDSFMQWGNRMQNLDYPQIKKKR